MIFKGSKYKLLWQYTILFCVHLNFLLTGLFFTNLSRFCKKDATKYIFKLYAFVDRLLFGSFHS